MIGGSIVAVLGTLGYPRSLLPRFRRRVRIRRRRSVRRRSTQHRRPALCRSAPANTPRPDRRRTRMHACSVRVRPHPRWAGSEGQIRRSCAVWPFGTRILSSIRRWPDHCPTPRPSPKSGGSSRRCVATSLGPPLTAGAPDLNAFFRHCLTTAQWTLTGPPRSDENAGDPPGRSGGDLLATCPGALHQGRSEASPVIWFYERRGEHLRCEIQQQIEGDKFALIVTLPDGTERVELFEDSGTLNRRSVELEKLLREKGWNGPFARGI